MIDSTPPPPDHLVVVCDKCFCASCWQGIFLCLGSPSAGTLELRVSELRALDRESDSYWGEP